MNAEPEGLHCGRWEDVLVDLECDALIVDAPHGGITHHHKDRSVIQSVSGSGGSCEREPLGYDPWTHDDVRAFVASWSPRTRGWLVSITDCELAPVWTAALREAGRVTFPWLPYLDRGRNTRIRGDGPSSWSSLIVVARPRGMDGWGTLPGAYERSPGDPRGDYPGGKPLGVMRALVRDYSRPGDLVCDPCAGSGTTLRAAKIEGRHAVGAESNPEAYAKAAARLAKPYTPTMF